MMLRSSYGGRLSIAAITKKIDVDHRISLHFYYRIADNILKQDIPGGWILASCYVEVGFGVWAMTVYVQAKPRMADIFREEKNVIDLYVMLLRFSSLVTETIPCHRDYKTSPQGNRLHLKRRLITAVTELEELKPAVLAKLEELHYNKIYQLSEKQNSWQSETQEASIEWPARQKWNDFSTKQELQPVTSKFGFQDLKAVSCNKPIRDQLQRISLNIPRPKEETLSKHSILGPSGLHGQWQPPSNYKVKYPSNADFPPLQVPGVNIPQMSMKDGIVTREDSGGSEREILCLESVVQTKNDNHQIQESDSLISFENESSSQSEIIRQPSPPPVLADVHDLVPTSTAVCETEGSMGSASNDALVCSEDPLQLHIPTELMDSFMRLAKSNTRKNLETCGVIAGSLKDRKFYITALIIPKQESTSDSCQTTNEEEIFEVQDKQCLFPLGWIHAALYLIICKTHPTQSCFMSSIDVHTHYSYQIMLPEAIAIVMAPRDSSRKHGIFRLTWGGMTVIRQCPRRGFHPHDPPSDGTPIYTHSTHVYMNPSLKFDVIDLR